MAAFFHIYYLFNEYSNESFHGLDLRADINLADEGCIRPLFVPVDTVFIPSIRTHWHVCTLLGLSAGKILANH